MIVSGLVLASPTIVRGREHTFECVLFSDSEERAHVCPNVIGALRKAFPACKVHLGHSPASVPVIRLVAGPIYSEEAILYIGAKLAGAVSMCFGGILIDLQAFVAIGSPFDLHPVTASNWHAGQHYC